VRKTLLRHPEFGLRPVGTVDHGPPIDETTIIGRVEEVPAIIERLGATRAIVAFGLVHDTEVIRILRRFTRPDVEIFVVPRFFEAGGAAEHPLVQDIDGIPLLWLRRRSSRDGHLRAKRIFDLVVGGILLLIAAPIMSTIAVAVKFTSRGPVFFRQRRVGRGGRPFWLIKFRSMHVNDDSDETWSVADDARVTRVGRFLRKTSLDELPQLLNVLHGDMSLVGPRPERPHYVEKFSETIVDYHERHRCPVGLTGLAQVQGLRGDTSIDERVRSDNQYIDQWCMWGDLVILFRTARAALRGR
jgi:exopolysaccharide biosynthesis polyprenyl glycosylphosphotransferase